MKKIICLMICLSLTLGGINVFAESEGAPNLGIDARAAILIEADSGEVLYEMMPDEQVPIASVTKIMTMLLIMEAVDNGTLTLDDIVTVSENAMSYGGSTMFLEAGEKLSVNDMLKGIAVASANDGCVAMAEHLAGSESAFVDMMNKKAQELGMKNTHFVNTNGLDADNHYSSARDVAIMSRELLKHKTIFNYTSIWTDTLRGGKFQLANTNKLIHYYDGANGLKTGSTSKALCCLSASAKRDDMQLIAVILGAPTSAKRFDGARAMLDYGFANYSVNVQVAAGDNMGSVPVAKGETDRVETIASDGCSVLTKKGGEEDIEKEIVFNDNVTAPVKAGDKLGTVRVKRGGEVIDEIDLTAAADVNKKGITAMLRELILSVFFGGADKCEPTPQPDAPQNDDAT